MAHGAHVGERMPQARIDLGHCSRLYARGLGVVKLCCWRRLGACAPGRPRRSSPGRQASYSDAVEEAQHALLEQRRGGFVEVGVRRPSDGSAGRRGRPGAAKSHDQLGAGHHSTKRRRELRADFEGCRWSAFKGLAWRVPTIARKGRCRTSTLPLTKSQSILAEIAYLWPRALPP